MATTYEVHDMNGDLESVHADFESAAKLACTIGGSVRTIRDGKCVIERNAEDLRKFDPTQQP